MRNNRERENVFVIIIVFLFSIQARFSVKITIESIFSCRGYAIILDVDVRVIFYFASETINNTSVTTIGQMCFIRGDCTVESEKSPSD